MNKNTKSTFRAALYTYIGMVAIFLIGLLAAKLDNKFPEKHFAKVESTVGEDGRAAVGSEEYYTYDISPALNWELGKGKGWRVIAIIVLIAIGIFMLGMGFDYINFERSAGNYIIWIGFIIVVACTIGAYSSSLVSNTITLTPEAYKRIDGDKKQIEQLFREKEFVR